MGFKWDGGIFARTYVRLKATRKLKEFFDGLGPEALAILVQENKDILPFLPPDDQQGLKQLGANSDVQKAIFDKLVTPDDVISCIPDQYRGIILRYPHGRDWTLRQINVLVATFLASP